MGTGAIPTGAKEFLTVDDVLDVGLHDSDALDEIEMTTDLIIAASESEVRLPQQRIDEILGVDEDIDED